MLKTSKHAILRAAENLAPQRKIYTRFFALRMTSGRTYDAMFRSALGATEREGDRLASAEPEGVRRQSNDRGNGRLQIGFVTSIDPMDRRSWSGTYYFMVRALQRHCGDVHCLGPVGSLARKAGQALWVASWLLFRRNYLYTHSPLLAKRYARLLEHRISQRNLDLLFAPAAAPEIAFLNVSLPIVYTADATFAVLRDYYPRFSRVLRFSAREADDVDRLAVRRADLLVYPSQWAACSAVRDYQGDESKIHVIPYGANIEDVPDPETIRHDGGSDECRLLFVGVKWARKGGDIAVETLIRLREMGIRAQLTICGCVPPGGLRVPGLQVIPFLDKNDPAQRKRLTELYLTSHFFLLPSRSECYGVAFCEANAFGLPIITTRTGGVPEIVEEGKNGFMLPMSARGPEYADLISRIWRDPGCYLKLVRSSRSAFEERLNWDAWAGALGKLLPRAL